MMDIPARYRSVEHFVDEMGSELLDRVTDLIEYDVPQERIAVILDDLFPMLLPATHLNSWSMRSLEDKVLIIWQCYDGIYCWKPTDADLALVDPARLDEAMAILLAPPKPTED